MSIKLLVTNTEYKHNENIETVLSCEKNLQERTFEKYQKSKVHPNNTGEKFLRKNCEILYKTQKKKPILNLKNLMKGRKTQFAVCKNKLRDNQILRKIINRIDQHTNSSSGCFKRFKGEGFE